MKTAPVPHVLRAKLDQIVHHGLVFIRNHGPADTGPDERRAIRLVADCLEPIPQLYHR